MGSVPLSRALDRALCFAWQRRILLEPISCSTPKPACADVARELIGAAGRRVVERRVGRAPGRGAFVPLAFRWAMRLAWRRAPRLGCRSRWRSRPSSPPADDGKRLVPASAADADEAPDVLQLTGLAATPDEDGDNARPMRLAAAEDAQRSRGPFEETVRGGRVCSRRVHHGRDTRMRFVLKTRRGGHSLRAFAPHEAAPAAARAWPTKGLVNDGGTREVCGNRRIVNAGIGAS